MMSCRLVMTNHFIPTTNLTEGTKVRRLCREELLNFHPNRLMEQIDSLAVLWQMETELLRLPDSSRSRINFAGYSIESSEQKKLVAGAPAIFHILL